MANRNLAEQALANRPEQENKENETYHYGGETLGRSVEALSDDEVQSAHDMVTMFNSTIERKYRQDPDSLSKAEVVLLNLGNKQPGEAYSPHEMAGLYMAMKYMEGQLEDPASDISKERNFGSDPERDKMRDAMLEKSEALQKSMFWKLTGIDKDRGLEIPAEESGMGEKIANRLSLKKMDGALREWSARHPNLSWAARVIPNKAATSKVARTLGASGTTLAAGESSMNRFITSRGGDETKSYGRLRFEQVTAIEGERTKLEDDHRDLLLLEKDIEANVASSWRALVTSKELSKAQVDAILASDDAEKELAKQIPGRSAAVIAQREAILRKVNGGAVERAMEKQYFAELDQLAEQAASREVPADIESLEDSVETIDAKIKQKEDELHAERTRVDRKGKSIGARGAQEKKLEDEIKALKAQRSAAQSAVRLSDPKTEKELRSSKNKNVAELAKMSGIDKAELQKQLEKEYGVSGEANVNKELAKQGSIGLFGMLMKLLMSMANG